MEGVSKCISKKFKVCAEKCRVTSTPDFTKFIVFCITSLLVSFPPQFRQPFSGMRLKIVVKRHGLPDSPIVWALENDPTISQILEQINEVLPLESGSDWGLEDYAFELKGQSGDFFECMHFQNARQILKDGDEVR